MYSNNDVVRKWHHAVSEANLSIRGNSENSKQIDQLRECVDLLKEAVRKRKELQKTQQSPHETVEFTIPAVLTHNEEEDAESKSLSSDEGIDSEVIESGVVTEDEVIESELVTQNETVDSDTTMNCDVIDIEMVSDYAVIGADNESSQLEPDDEAIEVESTEIMATFEPSITGTTFDGVSDSQEASTDEESEISLKNQTLEETPEQLDDSSTETPPLEEESYTCYEALNLEGGIQHRRMILAAHPIDSSDEETPMK